MDVFLYNGNLERGSDLEFIEFVAGSKASDELMLILVTPGGNPDAAYKIGKYLQDRYSVFSVFVSGLCKSAGTLLAIAANELIFSPYGELGPLDVQMFRKDSLMGLESGLNIGEAFVTLESRAKTTFHKLVMEIVSNSGGVVSFQTASHSAAEVVSSLYGPIFGKIDPEEVGSRARAMRIGEDYGKRLSKKSGNLKQGALRQLAQTYSSHGFVIDRAEAGALFERVRDATELEKRLVSGCGMKCRFPTDGQAFENLTEEYANLQETETSDDVRAKEGAERQRPRKRTRTAGNGEDSAGAGAA